LKETPSVYEYPAWIRRDLSKFSSARRARLERFLEDLELRGASIHTISNYVKAVRSFGWNGKPFEELGEKDMLEWLHELDSNGYGESTVNLTRAMGKSFLRWVHGCRGPRDPTPDFLRCVRKKRTRRGLPSGILTKAEIRAMIDACQSQRDRAWVFATWESGCRAGEILGLRIKGIEFDRYGAVLHINGKTGPRRVRLVESVPDLQLWISMHPYKDDPEAPLWPRTRHGKGKPMGISGFADLLDKLASAAGIKKHVHPHLLRHSRATDLANVLTEAQMREYFGWTKNSDMPSIYVHLSGRDVDSTLLRHYGIKEEAEEEEGELAPKTCPRCGFVNSVGARYCQRCSACLDLETAVDHEEMRRLDNRIVGTVVQELINRVPSLVETVIREKGLVEGIKRLDKSR
jgi:integrase